MIAQEHGIVQGLVNGLFYRIALISTAFFLVNSFMERTTPLSFPARRRVRQGAPGGRRRRRDHAVGGGGSCVAAGVIGVSAPLIVSALLMVS